MADRFTFGRETLLESNCLLNATMSLTQTREYRHVLLRDVGQKRHASRGRVYSS